MCIASLARWNAQLKGLAELEKRCQNMMQEVKLLSEKQKILKGMVEDKIRLQSRAREKYYEQIFEEMKELEENKAKEALLLMQTKHTLMRRKEADLQDLLSAESCRSSAVDYVEEISRESPRKMQCRTSRR